MNIFKKCSPKATKRFLATLLCGTLVLGTLGANAISIGFDNLETESNISFEDLEQSNKTSDLEQSDKTSESEKIETVSGNEISISEDEINYIDEYYLPEITEESVLYSDVLQENQIMTYASASNSLEAMFVEATNINYYGNSGGPTNETFSQEPWNGALSFVGYNNTSVDTSKYVVYENAVQAGNTTYDLVVYPFKGNKNAQVFINTGSGKIPAFRTPDGNGYAGYKLYITQHGNRNSTVSMNVLLGIADLDSSEYFILPSDSKIHQKGNKVSVTAVTTPMTGTKYQGTVSSTTKEEVYETCAVYATLNISSSGTIVYYGGNGVFRGSMSFKDIENNVYQVLFNANGGSGTPNRVFKYGTDSSVVMGDISSTVPTRSGYTFKGWSASSSWSSKRIAYSSSYGGSAAKDGTSATTTGSSWTYANYCSNTGGNSSNRTLLLYAQWEADTYDYTIQFNANGGTGSIPSTITKSGTDSSVVMGDIGSSKPTRSGYEFRGWSASSSWSTSNKRIAYSGISGATTTSSSWSYATYCTNTGGSSSSRTLTLYAQWEPTYSHTLAYNANGGTNAPSSSTVTNTSSTYSMTVSSSQPTRTGYTFAGWNTNSSGTGTNYSAGNSVSVGANATVTLYAKWTPITYSITYNGNGNTGGSTASQTKTYNVAINLQNNGFTKTGYHFTGWNTASNGTGTSYSAGASYNSNANLALYAQWAINSSTLKVNPNGGSWNNSTTTQSFTQNYNTTKSIPVPTRTGYTFTTWTRGGTNGSMSSLTGNATYTFGASNGVTDTLTAGWKINNYTVTYIDVIDSQSGKELGRSTASKPYNSTVRGADKGSSTTDNAYYNGYYYVSDTSATVTTSGATVYRIFKQRMNTIAGNIIWEDWNNKNLSRPENVNLYIKGSDGKTYSYVITGNHSQNTSVNSWPYSYDLPKYDSNGNVIVYTVSQDKAISQEEGLYYQEPIVNGYNITNKATNKPIGGIDPYPTKVTITITWDDENDFYGFRPENATIQLLRNGEVIKTADVSDSYTFTDLLKYDENGNKYVYTIQASDEKRYTKVENNSAPYNKTVIYTFVESSFSVLIPKVIVLDGNQGNADYDITVNGAFYYNDTLTVKPANSFTMTDRSNISSMKANILQSKQSFMKSDIASNGSKTTGSIQVDRSYFAGLWSGTFNFDIKFVMQN